jgi:NADPH:quinone reductase
VSTTAEFRRWFVREHGAPQDVLELGQSAVPPATDGEMVVEVEACALNFADDLLCRGKYQAKPPLPFTPGLEFAGVVVDASPGARHDPGDRVVGSAQLPYGALAERCRARVDDAYRLPADIPAVDAVAMHVTYQTCWFALHRRARVQPNDTVLVHAGAGGVGSAAIQLAKAAGARVITTAGGPDKVARCVELGADLAIDHSTDDFVVAVNEATGGLGADIVLDPVGGDTFERSRHCIAWEGRILVVGAAGGTYFSAPTNHVMVKNYSVVGVHWGGYLTRNPELVRGAHDDLMRLHRAGVVKPLVSRVVPLEAAREALVELAEGRTVGKIVVELRP